MKVDLNWNRHEHKWCTPRLLRFHLLSSVISTSFPLPASGSAPARFVNTRTADLEFSSSSSLLGVASNFIQGGFLSVIRSDSLLQDDATIYAAFNSSLSESTQHFYQVSSLANRHNRNQSRRFIGIQINLKSSLHVVPVEK